MPSRPRRHPHLCLLLAILVGVFANTATAEGAWTEEKARSLSTELAASLEALVAAAGKGPAQASAIQQRKLEAALVDLRQIRRMADELAQKLDAGSDRDATAPLVRQISQQRQAVRFYAKDTTVQAPARQTVERAVTALSDLETLYEMQ